MRDKLRDVAISSFQIVTNYESNFSITYGRKAFFHPLVIPAKAGIHPVIDMLLDSRFRGNDMIYQIFLRCYLRDCFAALAMTALATFYGFINIGQAITDSSVASYFTRCQEF